MKSQRQVQVTSLSRVRSVLVLLLLMMSAGSLQAQEAGSLEVVSNPPGAEAVVKGDAQVTGITPTVFRFPMVGEYRLTIKKTGFEKYSTKLLMDPANPMRIDVDLVPKTGFKAAVRSMFVPGWGQAYTGQKTKAFTFAVLFSGSVAAFFVADNNFGDKKDDFERSKQDYDDALSAGIGHSELKRLSDARNAAQEDAFDAETTRRISIGAAAGIWGLNVLDAFLFTRTEKGTFSIQGVGVTPSTDGETVSLSLSKAF